MTAGTLSLQSNSRGESPHSGQAGGNRYFPWAGGLGAAGGLGGDFRNSAEWPRRRRAATGRMIWNA